MTRNTHPDLLISKRIPQVSRNRRAIPDTPGRAIPRPVHLPKVLGPHHQQVVQLILCEPIQTFPLRIEEVVVGGDCLMPQLIIKRESWQVVRPVKMRLLPRPLDSLLNDLWNHQH